MTKLMTAATAALTLLATASAHAETRGLKMVTTTLAYETQDLANPAGAGRMLVRIDRAARQLCAPGSPLVRHVDAQSRLCREQAIARAVEILGAPLVTAAYQGRQVELAAR